VMGEKIGRGSFADVFKAKWRHTDVAVKKLVNTHKKEAVDDFTNETKLMLTFRHPNIVTFMGTCVSSDALCLVTEFLERGTLYEVLHNPAFNPDHEDIRRFCLDCCRGMAYLHGSSVIHRDLKSKNLLIDRDWNLKVSDFGLAKLVGDNEAHTFTVCGTIAWTAPEVLRNTHYSFEADIYSFGIILYEMLTREEPYKEIPSLNVVVQVAMQGLRPSLPQSIAEAVPLFEDIMKRCWQETPLNRPQFGTLSEEFDEQSYHISPNHLHNQRFIPVPNKPKSKKTMSMSLSSMSVVDSSGSEKSESGSAKKSRKLKAQKTKK